MISKAIANKYLAQKGLKEVAMNLIIRGLNLFSKFFLTLYLAKYTSIVFLGEYSVFVTTITICIYILGLEFYAFAQREYLKDSNENIIRYLKNQFVVHFLVYLLFVPFICFVAFKFIQIRAIFFFGTLMVLEHFNQELYRLLVVRNKPTIANISYFLRSGIWIISFIALSYHHADLISLNFLFYNWLVGEIICLAFSLFFLKELHIAKIFTKKIDWAWIKKGLYTSSFFFISGIILKLIEYSERFFIQKIVGEKLLGVYFFFYNIAYIPYIFFTSVIVINFLPKIVTAYTQNDQLYSSEKKKFIKSTHFFLAVIIPVTIVFYFFLNRFYLTDILLIENRNIFWGLMFASAITIYTEIFYLELYIRHLDKQILISFLIVQIICLLANYFLITQLSIIGAVVAKIVVALSLLFTRYIILRKNVANF